MIEKNIINNNNNNDKLSFDLYLYSVCADGPYD